MDEAFKSSLRECFSISQMGVMNTPTLGIKPGARTLYHANFYLGTSINAIVCLTKLLFSPYKFALRYSS